MEIALLAKDSLRIRGKHATFLVDPQEKTSYNAAFLLRLAEDEIKPADEGVIISGPGEYEIGGVKISGFRGDKDMVYSLTIDGVSVLIGKIQTIEKLQQKLKEHNIVVAYEDAVRDAAFITAIANNAVVFYGEKGREIANSFGKESVKEMNKYVTTVEKLPQEVETVILV